MLGKMQEIIVHNQAYNVKKEVYKLNQHYPFINVPLPYAYDALEPYIDEKTMHLHHDKHLQTYIDNLNKTLKDYPELQELSLKELITKAYFYPAEIRTPIINNAGGVYNHQFYFSNLKEPEAGKPVGILAQNMDRVFGGYEQFIEQFTVAALSVFGSGYAWLIAGNNGMLNIVTTANQNTPYLQDYTPVLSIDVWEHAYYLKHYNVRADYIKDWFHVVNWERANQNYLSGFRRGYMF